jgi:ubiquinone/menaquinone biosynthesis C-methylase UbiE
MTFPEIYERVLVGPLFTPFAEELVARLNPVHGQSLIDVACGTGIVARVYRNRFGQSARIVGVDVSPPMLEVARRADDTIDWRQGNAAVAPVSKDESFSLLTCHQGVQFFPDKGAAVSEMRRVLAPDGRVAVACWQSLQDNSAILELNNIAERHIGAIVDSRHSFGNPETLRALLADHGFQEADVDTFTHDVRFPDGALFARLNAIAVIGMTDTGTAMDESERDKLAGRIAAESREIISRFTKDGEFIFSLATNIATARA